MTKIKQPCKNPCPECAYRKDSMPGYFGGNDKAIYRNALFEETIVPCHTRSGDDTIPCTGHILAQINSCKSPKINQAAIEAHAFLRSQPDHDEQKGKVLSQFTFDAHHGEANED